MNVIEATEFDTSNCDDVNLMLWSFLFPLIFNKCCVSHQPIKIGHNILICCPDAYNILSTMMLYSMSLHPGIE